MPMSEERKMEKEVPSIKISEAAGKAAESVVASGEKVVKTSVSIAESLWKRAKIAAIKRGLTLTEIVEMALRRLLEEEGK